MRQLINTLKWLAPWVAVGLAAGLAYTVARPWLETRGLTSGPSAPTVAPPRPTAPAEPGNPGSSPAIAATSPTVAVRTPDSHADAVAASAPAVVNVFTERVVRERQLPPGWESLFGDVWPSYRERVERSLGSGVIYDTAGHVVTNNHVIAGASQIQVELKDGRTAPARIVGTDPDTDLAVLEIALKNAPVMRLGRSDTLRVGEPVLAIGNPLGLGQTVTSGIVSATSRGRLGVSAFESFIQTDAAINFGNSGGALVNARGQLIGINTAILARSAGIEGIGFAIPVDLVRGVVEAILRNGRVVRGWIGVLPRDIPPDQAAQFGYPPGGAVITNFFVGSPAIDAGMQRLDVVTEINGEKIRGAQDLVAKIAALKPGHKARVTWLRGPPFHDSPQAMSVRVPVVERPLRGGASGG
jgi:S1-C subfamily serine protease